MPDEPSEVVRRAAIAAIHDAIGEANARMSRERMGSLERARAYGETIGLDKATSILQQEFKRNV